MKTAKQGNGIALALRLSLTALLALSLFTLTSCFNPYMPPTTNLVQVKPPPIQTSEGTLEVVYLDVGEANAALVSSEGYHMLIDGGNVGDSSLLYSTLNNRGITKLDYIIFSHVDEDHIGGFAGALNFASVNTCYGSDDDHNTKAFNNFKKSLDEQGVSITIPVEDVVFTLGSATVSIWHVADGSDANSNELIVRIENGSDSFLFTGDIDSGLERLLIDEYGAGLESDVLLVPHHGSKSSSSYIFLREVAPEYSVLSVGKNSYGHPSEDALSRYRDLGATLLRTDLHGSITFTSGSDNLLYKVENASDENT